MKDLQLVQEEVARNSASLKRLEAELGKVVVGQQLMISRLLIGLLTGGHVLLEGVPGLAKTTAVNALAKALSVQYQRIQFTPDLLPADLIGTMIYVPATSSFTTRRGPIFANLVLADEINRAPSKVQSALLEAMQERQVTIGDETYALPNPFLVLATQNPIEQEGTYPLPEAQTDRFMLKVRISYPKPSEERKVLDMALEGTGQSIQPVLGAEDIFAMQKTVQKIYVDEQIRDYILSLVSATRHPADFKLESLVPLIEFGASPRATVFLGMAARAVAFLSGRSYVTPQDVKDIAHDVLRHRILLTYEAEAEQQSSDDLIDQLLAAVPVP